MNTTLYTVKNISEVTGVSKKAVEKSLKEMKVVVPMSEIENGIGKGFTNLRVVAKLCRDINPEEISVRYAAQELRDIALYA